MPDRADTVRGCLLGMAVGDAMGYTVDGKTLTQIQADYGPNGLLGYDLVNGYADITSYTQVAAYTANAILLGLTRRQMQGRVVPPVRYIGVALREWSRTQQYSPQERNFCWLTTVPQMRRRRCLDTRMLDALSRDRLGSMAAPRNGSNLPSSLTEAMPIALMAKSLGLSPEERNELAAQSAAMTHGSQEAWLSTVVLAHGLSLLLTQPKEDPAQLLRSTVDAVQLQFGRRCEHSGRIWELLQLAQTLAEHGSGSTWDAMEQLGCETAAEVLAGAVYACLTCHDDFDTAMITAVNHSGRSAAVGAVTGALLGAKLGAGALPDFYLESLEAAPHLLELSDDLVQGCPMGYGSSLFDDDWDHKYLHAGR